jgi:Zn-dependent alcohol dehydrogenase
MLVSIYATKTLLYIKVVDDMRWKQAAQLPAVGGLEGVAVVEAVGNGVKNVRVGDW